jgi:3-oxoacyl-[acyl-carrier-protein] synthase III
MRAKAHGGNAVFHYTDTAILAVGVAEAPIVVTSDDFDEQLAPTLDRVGLRSGMLEGLAGIRTRRWWPEDVNFADAAAMAGRIALEKSGIDAAEIGLLIDTSVCRDHLEPSAAVDVHHQLGLSTSCLNFDLANACLGFVNGMQLAATMIDAGQINYALIVDGEGSRRTQEGTLRRLQDPSTTRQDVLDNFATLTLGSGGAAMVLGRASEHEEGHRFIGGVSRAATQYKTLCIGDLDHMITDSNGLLRAGVELAGDTWDAARGVFDWDNLDSYVIHQVSKVHTAAITERLGIDSARVPVTFPDLGNIGPASVPTTLAHAAPGYSRGQRVACMGIGSGLNSAVIEIDW